MANKRQYKVLITGGGTGGHVFPAIAIADAIRHRMPEAQFLFVGANGKMEMERVPKAGYDIVGLNIAGFHRGFSLRNLGRNLSFPYKLLSSLWKARRLVAQFQPDIVIGTGGYASGPVMKAAQRVGIPTVLQEQNSYAGVTNKLLAKEAAAICVAYDGMSAYFPDEKIIFTGNPVRQDILQVNDKKTEARQHFQLDAGKKVIAVLGGSLGARTLNSALRDNAALLAGRDDIQVLWQCGRLYHEEFKSCDTARLPQVKILPFIDRMDWAYAASDIIISRAGALSISELCLVGKPVILVPSPNVAEDHQTKNALALVDKGAARLVRDGDAGEKMIQDALLVLENEALAFSLSESIRQLGKPAAADAIASVVLDILEQAKQTNA